MTTHALIEECRAALAEELAAWNIDPPLHHVKQAHDRCVKWLAMTHTVESLMMLADKVARCDVERGIPTGGLYRGITHNAWVNARDELRHALAQALAPTAQPAAEPVDSLLGKLVGAAMDLEREQGANAGMDESSSAWQLVKSLERRVLKAANAAQPAAEPAFPHCKQCGSSAWMCSVCPQPAAQPAAEPLTDEQIDMMWRRAGIANNARGAFFAGVAAGEWLRRLGECLPHSNTPNVGVKTRP